LTPSSQQSEQAGAAPESAFAALQRWYRSPLGALVAEQEAQALRALVEDLFGYHLIQVGEVGPDDGHLRDCPIRHKAVLSVSGEHAYGASGAVVEDFRLPLATDSIDAVIYPHVLEFSADPYQMLREADRVLIPGGRLVVCGFNPVSLCGLRRWLPGARKRVPWSGRFLGHSRLEDWMSLMGLEIERTEVCLFRPPVARAGMLRRFAFLDGYGARWWPMFAGVYLVRAVKRVSLIRPIEPRWRRLRPVSGGAIEPTTRGMTRG
jgi:SAM-dependent methyltransferase